MMKKLLLLSAFTLLVGFSTETFAQGYYNRGNRMNERSDSRRVWRGVRSGQITRGEARQIRERERQIREERRGYRSDGTLSRAERREIRRDEREQDRLVQRYRRNGNQRAGDNNYYDGRRGDDRRYGYDARRGNGYYRRGAGSARHPVFGTRYRY